MRPGFASVGRVLVAQLCSVFLAYGKPQVLSPTPQKPCVLVMVGSKS